jgi:hypothetical protein
MPSRHDVLVRRFVEACALADLDELRAVLDRDAAAVCDGGGVLPAIGTVHGAEDVARLAWAVLCGRPDTELTVEVVNGRAGLALRRAGRAVAVIAFETAVGGITVLWIVLNPAKLNPWHRTGPLPG